MLELATQTNIAYIQPLLELVVSRVFHVWLPVLQPGRTMATIHS
jgi:hypothetical protein